MACSLHHAANSVEFSHGLCVFASFPSSPEFNFVFKNQLLLLPLNFFFSLGRARLYLALKDFVFRLFLCELVIDFLEQFLFNHASEAVSHCVACTFESA